MSFSQLNQFLRSKPTGQFALTFNGLDYIPGGAFRNIEMAPAADEEKIFSGETPIPQLVMTDYGNPTLELTAELEQIHPDFLHILFASVAGQALNQAAAADQEFILLSYPGKKIRRYLPHRDVTVTMVTGNDAEDNPVEYVKNTHYRIMPAIGMIEITKHPEDVVVDADGKADVTVSYDAALITGRKRFALLSNFDVRCGFQFVSVNDWGHKYAANVWNCQAKFENIRLASNTNEFASASLKLSATPDLSKPAGDEMGVVELLSNIAI